MAPAIAHSPIGFFCFLLLACLGFASANDFPIADSEVKLVPKVKPFSDSLDRYLQWGLFDSLDQASTAILNQWPSHVKGWEESESDQLKAILYHFRALGRFGQQDTATAKPDFVAAACWNSPIRLDSFYIPPPMIRFNDSVFQQVEAQPSLCLSHPGSDRSQLSTPMSANPKAASAWQSKAAWGLAGLAAGTLVWTGYEQMAMQNAYDKQSEAGRMGDTETYAREGRLVRSHFNRRNAALLATVAFASGSGWCFYWNRSVRTHVSPNALSLNWSF